MWQVRGESLASAQRCVCLYDGVYVPMTVCMWVQEPGAGCRPNPKIQEYYECNMNDNDNKPRADNRTLSLDREHRA